MTPAQFDMLEFAAHMQQCHGPLAGALTGRTFRKRTAEQCVRRGWLERALLRVVDGDGFALDPERWRNGYRLTASGRLTLAGGDR